LRVETVANETMPETMSIETLRRWIGKTAAAEDRVMPGPAHALAATLDRDLQFAEGDPLPPPWHWLYFVSMSPMAETGPDGHPKRGGFLPPVPLPRRMWAGSRMEFFRPLRVGDTIRRVSEITHVGAKEGRSGPLVFVTVRHEIAGPDGPVLTEEHDIAYRDLPKAGEKAPPARAAPPDAAWQREIVADPVLLFRYSALTYNSHRIHYDHPYVTAVEGYPGLVVHGPLLATLLLDLLLRNQPQAIITRFEFRARLPLFDTAPFSVCGRPDPDGGMVNLWAQDAAAQLCMDATALVA
jgi:3-methylfumaryl-CoA hydratase